MDQERALEIARITHDMDATRQAIRDTVGELKERVHESADWRQYVMGRPIASLVVAAACGLALARILMPAARLARGPLSLAPWIVRRARPAPLPAPWSRLLFGAAGLLTELAGLPSLVSRIREVLRRPGGRTRR
jgi:hypothetical protein